MLFSYLLIIVEHNELKFHNTTKGLIEFFFLAAAAVAQAIKLEKPENRRSGSTERTAMEKIASVQNVTILATPSVDEC